MLGGDATHSGYVSEIDGPQRPPSVRWEYRVPGWKTTPPVVGKDTVYVADGTRQFHGINVRTGEIVLKWSTLGALAGGADVVAAAAVGRDLVYLPTNDGSIWGFEHQQGTKPWQFSKIGEQASVHYTSPVLSEGTLIVGSASERVLSIDVRTRDSRWSTPTNWPVIHGPAVDDVAVYATGSGLSAFTSDTGRRKWSIGFNRVLTAPVLEGSTVYAQTQDEGVVALAKDDRTVKWRYTRDGATDSRPAVTGDTVYVGRKSALHAIDAATGEQVWQTPVDANIRGSPAVADETVYVGTESGTVFALATATGAERWRFETGGAIRSAPALADGSVTVANQDGVVVTLE
ncbi:MAG: PQQ-binding-like beta-propeller repeat protein [Halobacteriaceae archaeon]